MSLGSGKSGFRVQGPGNEGEFYKPNPETLDPKPDVLFITARAFVQGFDFGLKVLSRAADSQV
jgi:hypothetical protein